MQAFPAPITSMRAISIGLSMSAMVAFCAGRRSSKIVARRALVALLTVAQLAGLLWPARVLAVVPLVVPTVTTGIRLVSALGSPLVVRSMPLALRNGVPTYTMGSTAAAVGVIGTVGLMGVNGEFLKVRPWMTQAETDTSTTLDPTIETTSLVPLYQARQDAGPNPGWRGTITDVRDAAGAEAVARAQTLIPINFGANSGVVGTCTFGSNSSYVSCSCTGGGFGSSVVGCAQGWVYISTVAQGCPPTGGWSQAGNQCRREVCPSGLELVAGKCIGPRYGSDGSPTLTNQNGTVIPDPKDPDVFNTQPTFPFTFNGQDEFSNPTRVQLTPRSDGGWDLRSAVQGSQQGNTATTHQSLTISPIGTPLNPALATLPGTIDQTWGLYTPGSPPTSNTPVQIFPELPTDYAREATLQQIRDRLCGGPNQPACKLDESGTPTIPTFNGNAADQSIDDLKGEVEKSRTMPGTASSLFTLQLGSCSSLVWLVLGRTITLDLCPYADIVREFLAWFFGALAAVYVWRRGHDAIQQGV